MPTVVVPRHLVRVLFMPYPGLKTICSSVFRYGCPLLFVVGVDDENRSCILGQGLLRSECTETFEWFLHKYETAAGSRRPKVISTQVVEIDGGRSPNGMVNRYEKRTKKL